MFQRRSELVELDLIRVLLRRVRALVRVREPGLPLRRPADLARGIVLDEIPWRSPSPSCLRTSARCPQNVLLASRSTGRGFRRRSFRSASASRGGAAY